MTNETSIDSGAQVQAPVDVPVQSEGVSTAESPKMASAEKMFTQSQVQAIAAKESRKAAEQAEAKIRGEYESKYSQPQQSHSIQQQQPQNSIGGMPQATPEMIRGMLIEEAKKLALENQAKQIEDNWLSSMKAEGEADAEFAQLYPKMNIESHPGLILELAGMDNKAQVVKELAKNPSKYTYILTLMEKAPGLVASELNNLSQSISTNDAAKKQPRVDAPLSQLKPSNLGGDGGGRSVSDFKNMPWLRG